MVAAATAFLAVMGPPRAVGQLPPAGYSLQFNGTDQSVNFSNLLNVSDGFTIEAWVSPATTNGTHAIAYNGNTSSNGWGIYQINSQFEALYGGVSLWGSGSVTPNVWQHVALSASGGVGTLYVNGVQAGSIDSFPATPSGSIAVGCTPQGINDVFDGQIDEVRVWSTALTATQVRTLRRVSVPGNTPGLFAEFHFNEGSGDVTTNSASTGGEAVLVNNPTWVLSGVPYGPTTTPVTTLADDGSPFTLRYDLSDALPGDTLAIETNGVLTLNSGLGSLVITQNVNIAGPGASSLALSGSNTVSIFLIQSNVTASLTGLTIENGYAGTGAAGATTQPGGPGASGGGIINYGALALTNCVLTANQAGSGGAGYKESGAGDPATDGGPGGSGGGIFSSNGSSLTLYGCTFSANAAGNGGAGGPGSLGAGGRGGRGGWGGHGGAIYCAGSLLMQNCTLAGNAAGNGAVGGAVPTSLGSTDAAGDGGLAGNGGGVFSSGPVLVISCTISSNNAGGGGAGGAGASSVGGNGGTGGNGGGLYAAAGAPALWNTIVAGNRAGQGGAGGNGALRSGVAGPAGLAADLDGSFTSRGHILIGQPFGALGFARGQNFDLLGDAGVPLAPGLAPLGNNGGPTPTMALLPSSPAIYAGDDTLAGLDQRGMPRPAGAHVDIGAFEFSLTNSTPPVLSDISLGEVTNDTINLLVGTVVNATLQPNALAETVFLQYGPTTNYGNSTTPLAVGAPDAPVPLTLPLEDLSPGLTWHVRPVGSNAAGTAYGPDLSFYAPSPYPPGDTQGLGYVDQAELDVVLSNYWTHSPWVQMTNVAGLGSTNVQFSLTNLSSWLFTVQASTNLTSWTSIGYAYPAYEFSDPEATNLPQRFYRLQWP